MLLALALIIPAVTVVFSEKRITDSTHSPICTLSEFPNFTVGVLLLLFLKARSVFGHDLLIQLKIHAYQVI
jgi:hypothetical protein